MATISTYLPCGLECGWTTLYLWTTLASTVVLVGFLVASFRHFSRFGAKLSPREEPSLGAPGSIAMNLQNLHLRCMQDEPHSFERILNECYAKQLLQEEVVEACWVNIIQGKNAYSAMQILSMLGTSTSSQF